MLWNLQETFLYVVVFGRARACVRACVCVRVVCVCVCVSNNGARKIVIGKKSWNKSQRKKVVEKSHGIKVKGKKSWNKVME